LRLRELRVEDAEEVAELRAEEAAETPGM